MANPIVSGITGYVEQNRLPLISKTILRGGIQEQMNLLTGVKGSTALNLIGSDIQIQSGADCGFTNSGSTSLSQRVLTTVPLKVNLSFCDKNLLQTWASYKVRMAATGKDEEEFPFAGDFVNNIAAEINKKNTKMIFQGASGSTTECEGLISILEGASVTTVSGATSAYTQIQEVYMAAPAEVAAADDFVIIVSTAKYREFIQELVTKNLYHYDPANGENEYKFPGTNVRVIATTGLDGADDEYVIGARLSNLFLGVDLVDDAEQFDFYWDPSDRIWKLAVEWNMGVQVAYPDEVVLGVY